MIQVRFIGTGDAFSTGGRRNSAILVRDGSRTLLLDCGPTTLQGLKELGIDPHEIDAIALSHYHGDHASGIGFMLLDYRYPRPRSRPLEIIGPPGVREFVVRQCAGYAFEFALEAPYETSFTELRPGRAIDVAGFRLTPYDAIHQPETRPHMLAVASPVKSLFFTGDTGWHDALPERVGDADLLISECTLWDESFPFHLSHERLVAERARFRAGRIVLTHMGEDVLRERSRLEFDSADDGLEIKV